MRLIDADKIGLTDFEIVMCNGDYREAFKMLLDKISNQPTAYDIDNVVKELEEEAERWEDSGKRYEDECEIAVGKGLRKAIEIVKQGGVSDDVCEWRCDAYGRWHTECHTLADNEPLEYIYCPYCGKKIKVVE